MTSTRLPRNETRPDFYPTPSNVTASIVPAIIADMPAVGRTPDVLDPCAGEGAILAALARSPVALRATFRGIELDGPRVNECRASFTCAHADALHIATDWGRPDVVVMNPPYSSALPFVQRAIAETAAHGGSVFALLRLAFLESAGRVDFHRANPSDVFVLARRPSFVCSVRCSRARATPKHGPASCTWSAMIPLDDPRPKACPVCLALTVFATSDSSAYAWFAWGPRFGGRWSVLP